MRKGKVWIFFGVVLIVIIVVVVNLLVYVSLDQFKKYTLVPFLNNRIQLYLWQIVLLFIAPIIIVVLVLINKEKVLNFFEGDNKAEVNAACSLPEEYYGPSQQIKDSVEFISDLVGKHDKILLKLNDWISGLEGFNHVVVIQHGSYRQTTLPVRDRDFVFLFLGVPKKQTGDFSFGTLTAYNNLIDISGYDYSMALNYITRGNIFFHSIVHKGSFVYGTQYLFTLLQRVAFKVLIAKKEVLEHHLDQLSYRISQLSGVSDEAPFYISAIHSYWIACLKLQIREIRNLNMKKIGHIDLYPLAELGNIRNLIQEQDAIHEFDQIVSFFKGQSSLPHHHNIRQILENFIKREELNHV